MRLLRFRARDAEMLAQGRAGVLPPEQAALLQHRHHHPDEFLEGAGQVGRREDEPVAAAGVEPLRHLVRDLAAHRATLLQGPRFVGTATAVADQMEEWFNSGGCDGFVLAATHLPGAFEEFVRMVVPVLQQRGLFRREYAGPTLREHLGIARPESR